MGQLSLKLDRPVVFRREDFVVAESNLAAAEALRAFPHDSDVRLALVGPEGCGKTHLARDWAARVDAVVLTPEQAADAELADFEGRPVLLDDADQASDETLFHLYNLAGVAGGALLLVSRRRPVRWATALPDLRSRLGAVRVVEVGEPDDDVLRGVLTQRFKHRGIKPSKDLLEFLVRRIERSAGAAAGVVDRLDEASGPEHRPVTRSLARQVLESHDLER